MSTSKAKVEKVTAQTTVAPKKVSPSTPLAVASADTESQKTNPTVALDTKTSKHHKEHKEKKAKLVRDSFTIPEAEYALFAALKQRALVAGRETKKSEILRAGLIALNALSDQELLAALNTLEKLKTGRPSK